MVQQVGDDVEVSSATIQQELRKLASAENKDGEVSPFSLSSLQLLGLHNLAMLKLLSPNRVLSIPESVSCIHSFVTAGEKRALDAEEKHVVVVVGVSGIGKSTAINYMMRHPMMEIPHEDDEWSVTIDVDKPALMRAQERATAAQNLQNMGKARPAAPTMPVILQAGHSNLSTTFLPQLVPGAPGDDLCFTDLPGFLENRGPEVQIANAANIKLVLTKCKTVKVIIMLKADNFRGGDRQASLNQLLDDLSQLFGGVECMRANYRSLLIAIVRALPGVPQDNIARMQGILSKHRCFQGLAGLDQQIILLDPMEKNNQCTKLDDIIRKLQKGLQAMNQPAKVFHTNLKHEDKNHLQTIANYISDKIRSAMLAGIYPAAAAQYRKLKLLRVIGNSAVSDLLRACRSFISDQLDHQRGAILSDLQSDEKAHRIRFQGNMVKLQGAIVLDDIFEEASQDQDPTGLTPRYANAAANSNAPVSAVHPPSNRPVRELITALENKIKLKERDEQIRIDTQLLRMWEDLLSHLKDVCAFLLSNLASLRRLKAIDLSSADHLNQFITLAPSERDALNMFMDKLAKEKKLREVKYYFRDITRVDEIRTKMDKSVFELLSSTKEKGMRRIQEEELQQAINCIETEAAALIENNEAVEKLAGLAGRDGELDPGLTMQRAELIIRIMRQYRVSEPSLAILDDWLHSNSTSNFMELGRNKIWSALLSLLSNARRAWSVRQLEVLRAKVTKYFAEKGPKFEGLVDVSNILNAIKKQDVMVYQNTLNGCVSQINVYINATRLAQGIEDGRYAEVQQIIQGCDNVAVGFRSHYVLNAAPYFAAIVSPIESSYNAAVSEIETAWSNPSKDVLKTTELERFILLHRAFTGFQAKSGSIGLEKYELQRLRQSILQSTRQLLERNSSDRSMSALAVQILKLATLWYKFDFIRGNNDGDMIALLHAELGSRLQPADLKNLGGEIDELKQSPLLGAAAAVIIEKVSLFKKLNVKAFAKKTGGATIESLLNNPQFRGEPAVNKPALKAAYDSYNEVYAACLTPLLKRQITEFPALKARMRAESKRLGADLGSRWTNLHRAPQQAGMLLGYIFAMWTYINNEADYVEGEDDMLLQPHVTQILSIFRLLGVDGDRSLRSQVCEMGTGEGKSICLGGLACFMALMGVQVDCVCYSPYLSNRDFRAFSSLFDDFEVKDSIRYQTIITLSNNILGEYEGNARNMIQNLAAPNSDPLPCLSTKSLDSKRVLLIDEVDVLFGQQFYGQAVNQVVALASKESSDLVKYVWNHRDSPLTVEHLMALPCCQSMLSQSPWLRPLLLKEMRNMLNDVKDFPGEQIHHECVSKDGKIYYRSPQSGSLETMWWGYSTFFAYLHYNLPRYRGTPQYLAREYDQLGVKACSGKTLYSELPNYYPIKLGITGTLTCLSAYEKGILSQFNIHGTTFMPSPYQKRPIVVSPIELLLTVDGDDGYHKRIYKDISDKFKAGRASLVVFFSETPLHAFRTYLESHPIKGSLVQILTDGLPDDERDGKVSRATKASTITLMTLTYGRGYDFVCQGNAVTSQGGVHVIQTFFSLLPSEEVQVKGRTGRQDDPGSYQCLLLLADLDRFNIKSVADVQTMKEHGEQLETQLRSRREKYLTDTYSKKIQESLDLNKPKHKRTLEFIQAYVKQNPKGLKPTRSNSNITNLFMAINDVKVE